MSNTSMNNCLANGDGANVIVAVYLIYIDILDFICHSDRKSPSKAVVGVMQSIQKKKMRALIRASPRSSTTGSRCGCMCVCVYGHTLCFPRICDPHMAEHSRKLCTWEPGVGVGLLTRKPCSLKDSEISYSRLNGDVSECKRRQWSKNECRPQLQGPAVV